MGNRPKRNPTRESVIPDTFGVSFSLKQCRDFQLDQQEALEFLLTTMGFRRFRLMSYWNEHEKQKGQYDFSLLDQQIDLIEKHNGVISLCLGVRQPRWPESHWPDWALMLSVNERDEALSKYIEVVVKRYKNRQNIQGYQLENEALNRGFGTHGDFNRKRLRHEYALVKKLDLSRPIIMSTSNTWGIPLRQPRPDMFGFTFYQIQYEQNAYSHTKLPLWWWSTRARLMQLLINRPSFIHELQAEPWGPKAIWEMSIAEQNESMNTAQLKRNIELAKKTNLFPIDLWGAEWWYWRHKQGDNTISQAILSQLRP